MKVTIAALFSFATMAQGQRPDFPIVVREPCNAKRCRELCNSLDTVDFELDPGNNFEPDCFSRTNVIATSCDCPENPCANPGEPTIVPIDPEGTATCACGDVCQTTCSACTDSCDSAGTTNPPPLIPGDTFQCPCGDVCNVECTQGSSTGDADNFFFAFTKIVSSTDFLITGCGAIDGIPPEFPTLGDGENCEDAGGFIACPISTSLIGSFSCPDGVGPFFQLDSGDTGILVLQSSIPLNPATGTACTPSGTSNSFDCSPATIFSFMTN